MQYMGSKRLLAKYIMPIILKDRKEGQCYAEPFVGGANSFRHVEGLRLGADSSHHVISALLLIRDKPEMLPKTADDITPELYQKIKRDETNLFHGYVGFACSFGGKYFGGRVKSCYPPHSCDHVAAQYKDAQELSKVLKGATLECTPYLRLEIPLNSIIYCDPPYEGTQGYTGGFDSVIFWQWCREKVKEGHRVFVSEYKAPDDFVCVFEKEHAKQLNRNNQKSTEKLFIHRSQV